MCVFVCVLCENPLLNCFALLPRVPSICARLREALILLSTDLDHVESAHVYARARHMFQWAYLFSCRRLCPAPSRESRCTQWLSPAKSAFIADDHRSTPAKWEYYGTPLLLEVLNAGTRVELLDAGLDSEQRDRVLFRQASMRDVQAIFA